MCYNFDAIHLILKSLRYVAKGITQKNLYYYKKFLESPVFKWNDLIL